MELWIRSQDKKRLKKVYSTIYLDLPMSNEIIADDVCVGEYKKERALEVLTEIQEKIKHINKFSLVNEDYECDDCVYEMPEK